MATEDRISKFIFRVLLKLAKIKTMNKKTLTLDEKTAREIYPTAAPEFKKLLEQNFTKEFFSQNFRDYVNTWEDVCKELGKDPLRFLPYLNTSDSEELAANAHWRITQTIKLFKKGVKIDYSPNNRQNKSWVWMEFGKSLSGLGFSSTGTGYVRTHTVVGPRLCSLNEDDARHIATVVCKEDYITYFNE